MSHTIYSVQQNLIDFIRGWGGLKIRGCPHKFGSPYSILRCLKTKHCNRCLRPIYQISEIDTEK